MESYAADQCISYLFTARVHCCICENTDESLEFRVLAGCGHVFHSHCIQQLIDHGRKASQRASLGCPLCRARICSSTSIRPLERLATRIAPSASCFALTVEEGDDHEASQALRVDALGLPALDDDASDAEDEDDEGGGDLRRMLANMRMDLTAATKARDAAIAEKVEAERTRDQAREVAEQAEADRDAALIDLAQAQEAVCRAQAKAAEDVRAVDRAREAAEARRREAERSHRAAEERYKSQVQAIEAKYSTQLATARQEVADLRDEHLQWITDSATLSTERDQALASVAKLEQKQQTLVEAIQRVRSARDDAQRALVEQRSSTPESLPASASPPRYAPPRRQVSSEVGFDDGEDDDCIIVPGAAASASRWSRPARAPVVKAQNADVLFAHQIATGGHLATGPKTKRRRLA